MTQKYFDPVRKGMALRAIKNLKCYGYTEQSRLYIYAPKRNDHNAGLALRARSQWRALGFLVSRFRSLFLIHNHPWNYRDGHNNNHPKTTPHLRISIVYSRDLPGQALM